MSDPISSKSDIDPDTGFTPAGEATHPSVSQAARELRDAAEGKVNETIHTAEEKLRGTLNKAKEKSGEFKERATQSARQFRESASEKAQHFKENASAQASQLRDNACEQWEETRVKAKEFHITAEDYIRQNPTKCVLTAIGAGFIIGLLVRR